MRILQLGKFYPVKGGVEKVMRDITLGVARHGIECDMMCAASEGAGEVCQLAPKSRLITNRTWTKLASTTIAPSMISHLRRIAPFYDIIHIHHPDPMAALALYCSSYKGKVILHWHSDIIKQKSAMRLFRPLQNWLLERADIIIGTSPDYLANSPYLKGFEAKTLCVPIGIKSFSEDFMGGNRIRTQYFGKKIVFSLGRLIPYKGLKFLLEAAEALPEDYVILIGGTGPLYHDLLSERAALGLENRVILLGEIPQEDLVAYYTACDVFCLPSVMKTEAFGIVQIEAMSLGKPVVATRIPGSGTAWVNSHGFSGLNVPIEDPIAIAHAIQDICSDTETYNEFSANARKRFESEFRLDLMIDRCLDIYRSLTGHRT